MRERDKPAYPNMYAEDTVHENVEPGLTKYERTVEKMAAAMIAGLWAYPGADSLTNTGVADQAIRKATAIWDALESTGCDETR